MALRNSWNAADTTNLVVSEQPKVTYTTEEIYYDVAPKGDPSQAPEYVTDAEAEVEAASDALEEAQSAADAISAELETAEDAASNAYDAWYADQTLAKYLAYMDARSAMIGVRVRFDDANAVARRSQQALDEALAALEKANERWAVEREGVYYKGGRFLGYAYHRFATGSYRYLGLTATAAETCRAALDALLTRHIAKSATLDDGIAEVLYQDANPSSVRAVFTSGDNYSVEVEISEDDVKTSPVLVDPATLFATENQRHYFAYEQNSEA